MLLLSELFLILKKLQIIINPHPHKNNEPYQQS